MTNKFIDKTAKELCELLDITYEKDVKLIKTTLELTYWTARAEQTKIMKDQQKIEKLWDVIPGQVQDFN